MSDAYYNLSKEYEEVSTESSARPSLSAHLLDFQTTISKKKNVVRIIGISKRNTQVVLKEPLASKVGKLKAGGLRPNESRSLVTSKEVRGPWGANGIRSQFLPSITLALIDADKTYPKGLDLKSNSPGFELRVTAVVRILELQTRLGLGEETGILAVSLLDRYLLAFPSALETRLDSEILEKVSIASLFIAGKFLEVSPPRIDDFAPKSFFAEGEFALIEGTILKLADYSIRPPPHFSLLFIVNSRVIGSEIFTSKIKKVILQAMIGNFLFSEKSILFVLALTQLYIEKNSEKKVGIFSDFLKEFGIKETLLREKMIKISQDIFEFSETFRNLGIEEVIERSLKQKTRR